MATLPSGGRRTVRLIHLEQRGFRPSGSSTVPLVRSRQLVTVAPVDPAAVQAGDIVLARVAGTTYLHLLSAVNTDAGRMQISNNRGRVNGLIPYARIRVIKRSRDRRNDSWRRRTTGIALLRRGPRAKLMRRLGGRGIDQAQRQHQRRLNRLARLGPPAFP